MPKNDPSMQQEIEELRSAAAEVRRAFSVAAAPFWTAVRWIVEHPLARVLFFVGVTVYVVGICVISLLP